MVSAAIAVTVVRASLEGPPGRIVRNGPDALVIHDSATRPGNLSAPEDGQTPCRALGGSHERRCRFRDSRRKLTAAPNSMQDTHVVSKWSMPWPTRGHR